MTTHPKEIGVIIPFVMVQLPGVMWSTFQVFHGLHFLDILVAMSSLVDSGALTQSSKLVPGDPYL